jgi:hypothetical protein
MFPVAVYAILQVQNLNIDTFTVYDYISYAASVVAIYYLLKFIFGTKATLYQNIDEFDNKGFLDGHEGWFLGLDITNMKEKVYVWQ